MCVRQIGGTLFSEFSPRDLKNFLGFGTLDAFSPKRKLTVRYMVINSKYSVILRNDLLKD